MGSLHPSASSPVHDPSLAGTNRLRMRLYDPGALRTGQLPVRRHCRVSARRGDIGNPACGHWCDPASVPSEIAGSSEPCEGGNIEAVRAPTFGVVMLACQTCVCSVPRAAPHTFGTKPGIATVRGTAGSLLLEPPGVLDGPVKVYCPPQPFLCSSPAMALLRREAWNLPARKSWSRVYTTALK